jgi:hypothetical protein
MDQQVQEPDEHVAPTDAMRDAFAKFGELRAYFQQYLSAKSDLAKSSAKNIAILAGLGIIGLFVVSAAMIIALVLLFNGIAGALGAAMGGRVWAGDLIVGAVLIALFAGGVVIGLSIVKKASLKATKKKYELKQREQLEAFGRSSRDRTAAQGRVEV